MSPPDPSPPVETPPTTPDQALAAADTMAGVLVQDALARDRAGAEPIAEARLLRRSGLPAILLPPEVGGPGLGWDTALEVVRRIARADGSIAQLLAYHYANVANLLWTAEPEGLRRWGIPSVTDQWLWGDAANPVDPDLRLTPDGGGGYRLNGHKTFATGLSSGDIAVVAGVVDRTGEPLLAVVRRTADGVRPGGDWDNLGQRLSASGSVTFTDVAIDPDQVLGSLTPDRVTPRGSLVTPAVQAAFGHLYLGLAEGALATARDYTLTSSRPWILGDADRASRDPYTLATYGRLVAATRAAAALAGEAASALVRADATGPDLDWHARGELAELVAALKVVTTDLALDVTTTVYEVTGARATANTVGLDRFWRNVRTHTLHDPVAHKRREVGDHYLHGTHPQFTLYT